MLPQKDNLHALIRGLSGSEKRFFKIFARNSAGRKHHNYLVLFDALAQMETYNRRELSEKLAGTTFVKHLNPTKSRLLELVLESLRVQSSRKSIDSELQNRLMNIELLIGRMQYPLARLKLNQTQKLATQTERYQALLNLLNLEIDLFAGKAVGDPVRFFRRMEAEQIANLKLIEQNSLLYALHERTRVYAQRFLYARNDPQSSQPFEEIIQNPLLQSPPPENSILGYIYHQNIWGIYFIRTGENTKAIDLYRKVLQKWESKPLLQKTEASLYLGTVNNYLFVLVRSTIHSQDYLSILRKLRIQPQLSKEDQLKLDRITYFHEFTHQMNYGNYEEGLVLADEITHWLKKNQDAITTSRRITFELNLTFFFFAHGNYSRTNRHLLKIINMPGRKERKDIRDFAPLLRLIVQFELGNFDYGEYLLRSADRSLRRNQKLYAYEEALIGYMQEIQELPPGRSAHRKVAEQLKDRLDEIEREGGENLIGLPIIRGVWLESKLKGVSIRAVFESIVQQNLKELQE